MTNPSADPVPAITEAEATGNIAAIYTDIRATLGVPVVNLIWRHLAVFPDGLPWAWESLKPLYASGAIAGQAAALRAGLEVPALPALSGPALAAAGISKDALTRITMILRSYERSNALNMIAHCALLARLEGKSSLGRLGLLIHSTAGFIDPGFSGQVTLELSNVANLPIAIYPNMKIGQISFYQMTTPAEFPYGSPELGSKYQGQAGPTPSQMHQDFRGS